MNVELYMKNTNNICKNDAVGCNSGSCILNCSLINYKCHRKRGNAETERHKNCDKYEKGGREKNGMLKGIRKIRNKKKSAKRSALSIEEYRHLARSESLRK